jgi:hypothetical protein
VRYPIGVAIFLVECGAPFRLRRWIIASVEPQYSQSALMGIRQTSVATRGLQILLVAFLVPTDSCFTLGYNVDLAAGSLHDAEAYNTEGNAELTSISTDNFKHFLDMANTYVDPCPYEQPIAIIRDCVALLGRYFDESVSTRLSAPALVSRASIAFRRTPFDEQSRQIVQESTLNT